MSAGPSRPARRASQAQTRQNEPTDYEPELVIVSDDDSAEDARQPMPSQRKRAPDRPRPTQNGTAAKRANRQQEAAEAGPSGRDAEAEEDTRPFEYSEKDTRELQREITLYTTESASRSAQYPLPEVTDAHLETMVGAAVRYMLFSHYEKPGVPVTRQKLCDAFMRDFNDKKGISKKITPVVIAQAQLRMLQVMGLEMKQVERRQPGDKKKADEALAGTKHFVLHSLLPTAVRESLLPPVNQRRGVPPGLTMVVLSLIQLDGGKMTEERLWEWLGQLGVGVEDGPRVAHPTLGHVKAHLQHMEQCRYIVKVKATNALLGPDAGHVYEWGECAAEEITEKGVKDYIEKHFNRAPTRDEEIINLMDSD